MRVISVAIIAFALVSPATAEDWQPTPDLTHQFTAPPETPSPATESENRWIESLVGNLKRGGADPQVVYRFSRSSAEYEANGEVSDLPIFVYRDNPDIFIVVSEDGRSEARFIVNFAESTVSAGGHGTSLFVPPSRRFCVIVLERDWGIGGIPVTGGERNPLFRGRTVTWH